MSMSGNVNEKSKRNKDITEVVQDKVVVMWRHLTSTLIEAKYMPFFNVDGFMWEGQVKGLRK